jgi:hypothetical protein
MRSRCRQPDRGFAASGSIIKTAANQTTSIAKPALAVTVAIKKFRSDRWYGLHHHTITVLLAQYAASNTSLKWFNWRRPKLAAI